MFKAPFEYITKQPVGATVRQLISKICINIFYWFSKRSESFLKFSRTSKPHSKYLNKDVDFKLASYIK